MGRIDLRNLNLLFNKEYYQELGTSDFQKDLIAKNSKLIGTCFNKQADYVQPPLSDCQRFRMKLLYPGLLIGIGYPHEVGKLESNGSNKASNQKDSNQGKKKNNSEEKNEDNNEEIKLGFSFDYVTGQPYIPASSIKGVLRSHFKYRQEAVAEILKNIGYPNADVAELEEQLFDKHGVIFFDAVICKGDAQRNMLGFDYITPHSSPTKNPNPIRMIKVLPDVQFEFRFKIRDIEINEMEFTADTIFSLFQELILLFGAGAKTNVGYGVFSNEGVVQP